MAIGNNYLIVGSLYKVFFNYPLEFAVLLRSTRLVYIQDQKQQFTLLLN